MRRLRVWNVITNTCYGGAESMLQKLAAHLDPGEFELKVISLLECGVMGQKIAAGGVPVEALGLVQNRVPHPGALLRLVKLLRRERPDVVQTWMYHADLCGGLAARLAGRIPVVWNVRHSTLERRIDKLSTRLVAASCARLSRHIPQQIVVNSRAGRSAHEQLGYASHKFQVIPNCFDLTRFHPADSSRRGVRRELGLAGDEPLVGLVGRFHEMKGHRFFVAAAAELARRFADLQFVLCGRGVEWSNPQLAGWIDEHGLRQRFHVLGPRQDMPRIQAALDVAVSASICGEGFSNVVGEAMASGVPCVVTDVGDSAEIVGETGLVVPPRNPAALAESCRKLLALSPAARRQLGHQARQRIAENYDIAHVAAQYAETWRKVCGAPRASRKGLARAA